jgi:hypothetical protein
MACRRKFKGLLQCGVSGGGITTRCPESGPHNLREIPIRDRMADVGVSASNGRICFEKTSTRKLASQAGGFGSASASLLAKTGPCPASVRRTVSFRQITILLFPDSRTFSRILLSYNRAAIEVTGPRFYAAIGLLILLTCFPESARN